MPSARPCTTSSRVRYRSRGATTSRWWSASRLAAPGDMWLLRFIGADGQPKRGRATTRQVVERLREGLLPRCTEVCRAAEEGFLPATFFPEFAFADDADVTPLPDRLPSPLP